MHRRPRSVSALVVLALVTVAGCDVESDPEVEGPDGRDGEGPPAMAPANDPWKDGSIHPEDDWTAPLGGCTRSTTCGAGRVCERFIGSDYGVCRQTCWSSAGCPAGWDCVPSRTPYVPGVCIP